MIVLDCFSVEERVSLVYNLNGLFFLMGNNLLDVLYIENGNVVLSALEF